MSTERFEWLEIPDEPSQPRERDEKAAQTIMGKRCPQCKWLDEEAATTCFRCGYRYNVDHEMAGRIAQFGVTLPPRVIETPQNLDNFFRTHGRIRPPEALDIYQLRMQAEKLRLSCGFDQLLCLDTLNVDHYEHQIEAALTALRDMRGRALLADEVGLGKTIEAGIIMKELIHRGLVRTVLVLTPASLTQQWSEEFSDKFDEAFTVVNTPAEWTKLRNEENGRWITSLDRAKLKQHSEAILARDYDLLIVDEAHKLKNRSTLAWKFVNQVRKRYVLMLTATPVQNDLLELYSLITILAPGQLGTARAFRRHFLDQADKARTEECPIPAPLAQRRDDPQPPQQGRCQVPQASGRHLPLGAERSGVAALCRRHRLYPPSLSRSRRQQASAPDPHRASARAEQQPTSVGGDAGKDGQ